MLIALIGEQGAGKDTVRKIIQHHYHVKHYENTGARTTLSLDSFIKDSDFVNDQFRTFISGIISKKFAEAPKRIVASILNESPFKWEDRTFKEEHREKLVKFSEMCKDIFGIGIWLKQAMGDYIKTPNQFLIIDDAGFKQELLAVKKYGGLIWKVTNKRVKESDQPRETAMREWTNIDFTIVNNGDIQQLRANVQEALSYQVSMTGINFDYGKKYLYK